MNSSPDESPRGIISEINKWVEDHPLVQTCARLTTIAGIAISTRFLPDIGPHEPLKDHVKPTTSITAIIPYKFRNIDNPNYLRYPAIVGAPTGQETPKPEPTLTDVIKDVVNDPRLNIPEEDKPFWNSRMRQIIKVESSDNPKAFSGKAYGFTQLRPATAQEEADRYGIHEYNLFNGRDNIFLGLALQLHLSKRYGTELGAWAHHLGSGNMDIALKTYFIEDLKFKVSEVDKIFNNPKSNEEISEIIKIKKITPDKLQKSPAVTGKLKQIEAHGDNTDLYYSRIMAVILPQTKV